MKRHALLIASAALVGLSACSRSDTPSPSAGVDPTDPCGAQGYTSLLGASLAAVTLPADLNDRVLRPGEAVTKDYDPSRLNIELDDNGTIIGLSCG